MGNLEKGKQASFYLRKTSDHMSELRPQNFSIS